MRAPSQYWMVRGGHGSKEGISFPAHQNFEVELFSGSHQTKQRVQRTCVFYLSKEGKGHVNAQRPLFVQEQ